MKLKLFYITLFAPVALLFSMLVFGKAGPENQIVGKWQEVAWQYEKMDRHENADPNWLVELEDQVKSEIGKSMFIHQAEVWEFNKDYSLTLSGTGLVEDSLRWKLKGRGNVLELQHRDFRVEDYQVQELTNDSMVIHFNTDIQARGIVKMIFKKIKG